MREPPVNRDDPLLWELSKPGLRSVRMPAPGDFRIPATAMPPG